MRTLDCNQASLDITLRCSSVREAALSSPYGSHPLTAQLSASVPAGPPLPVTVTLGGIPPNLQTGTWYLYVDTDCGCFMAPVYVRCNAPAFVSEHTATSSNELVEQCCPEELAPDLTVNLEVSP